jgi:hypothetical protein
MLWRYSILIQRTGVQELIKENRQQQKQIDDLTTRLARLEQLLIPTV